MEKKVRYLNVVPVKVCAVMQIGVGKFEARCDLFGYQVEAPSIEELAKLVYDGLAAYLNAAPNRHDRVEIHTAPDCSIEQHHGQPPSFKRQLTPKEAAAFRKSYLKQYEQQQGMQATQ